MHMLFWVGCQYFRNTIWILDDWKLDILMQKARKLKAKWGHISGQVLGHLVFRIWVCFLVHGVEWLMMVLPWKRRFYWNLLRHYHNNVGIRSKKWLWLVLFRMCYELNIFVSTPPFIHWSPNPQCDGMWRWSLWGVIKVTWGHKNGDSHNGIRALRRRDPREHATPLPPHSLGLSWPPRSPPHSCTPFCLLTSRPFVLARTLPFPPFLGAPFSETRDLLSPQ